MRECVDEGVLQSYFDGELSGEIARGVASHLASCLTCTQAARELEEETLLLSQALDAEFSGSVPTERLRHKVDAAIAGLSLVKPERAGVAATAGGPAVPVVRGWLDSIAELFRVSPQRGFAYAGLAAVVLFAVIFVLVQLKRPQTPGVAGGGNNPTAVPINNGSIAKATPVPSVETPRPAESPREPKRRIPKTVPHERNQTVAFKLIPGERSYLKTIAKLDSTIKEESNKPMRPAMQAEYERNLAVVEHAIAATRSAAKSKPNDPDAAEFMFAAYQSKVDLLNQVADSRLSNRPKP